MTTDMDDTIAFNPNQPVSESNPIPQDCVCFTHPYPGPHPPLIGWPNTIPGDLRKMGVLIGRPVSEIIGAIGRPNGISYLDGGRKLMQWQKISVWTGSYHYALKFDPYDICMGITHEWVQ